MSAFQQVHSMHIDISHICIYMYIFYLYRKFSLAYFINIDRKFSPNCFINIVHDWNNVSDTNLYTYLYDPSFHKNIFKEKWPYLPIGQKGATKIA